MVLNIGRICVKIAGRDAGKRCVIVKEIDNTYVIVDGQTRRRKVNKFHLEPLDLFCDVSEDADNATVVKVLKDLGIECVEKVSKENTTTSRPKKQKKIKSETKSEDKPKTKKEKAPKEEKPKKEKVSKKVKGDEE